MTREELIEILKQLDNFYGGESHLPTMLRIAVEVALDVLRNES